MKHNLMIKETEVGRRDCLERDARMRVEKAASVLSCIKREDDELNKLVRTFSPPHPLLCCARSSRLAAQSRG